MTYGSINSPAIFGFPDNLSADFAALKNFAIGMSSAQADVDPTADFFDDDDETMQESYF